MATLTIESPVTERSSERTREHLFFSGIAGLIALAAGTSRDSLGLRSNAWIDVTSLCVGSARTWYVAAAAPLPARQPLLNLRMTPCAINIIRLVQGLSVLSNICPKTES